MGSENPEGLAKMSWTIWRLWVLMESDLSGSWVDHRFFADRLEVVGMKIWKTQSLQTIVDHFLFYDKFMVLLFWSSRNRFQCCWIRLENHVSRFVKLCTVDWKMWSQIQSGDDFTKLHGIVSGWLKVSSVHNAWLNITLSLHVVCILYTTFLVIFAIHNYAIVCKYMICCGMDL